MKNQALTITLGILLALSLGALAALVITSEMLDRPTAGVEPAVQVEAPVAAPAVAEEEQAFKAPVAVAVADSSIEQRVSEPQAPDATSDEPPAIDPGQAIDPAVDADADTDPQANPVAPVSPPTDATEPGDVPIDPANEPDDPAAGLTGVVDNNDEPLVPVVPTDDDGNSADPGPGDAVDSDVDPLVPVGTTDDDSNSADPGPGNVVDSDVDPLVPVGTTDDDSDSADPVSDEVLPFPDFVAGSGVEDVDVTDLIDRTCLPGFEWNAQESACISSGPTFVSRIPEIDVEIPPAKTLKVPEEDDSDS